MRECNPDSFKNQPGVKSPVQYLIAKAAVHFSPLNVNQYFTVARIFFMNLSFNLSSVVFADRAFKVSVVVHQPV